VYGGNDKIYTLKGNARYNEFYCYNINSNTWQTKESLPFYHPFIRKKTKIKSGGAMCFNGLDIIYAIKGGGQNEFWQYNTLTNQWFPLETIPRVNKKSVVKSGASLAFADNRVWLLKGNNTWEMWSYATQNTKSDIQGINNISLKTNLCTRKIIHLQKNNRKTMDNILIDIQNNLPIKIFDIQGKLVQSVNDKSFLSLDYLPVGVYIIVAERIYH